MSTTEAVTNRADREFKAGVRRMWAMGDYATFSRTLIWEIGPIVVEAAGVRPGLRVLDVAAGTGNVAIRAAEAGGDVVASDLTPEHFAKGREIAREHGVELAWVEADAESLPFADAEFDIVTSAFGAIFAPRHQRVADEMVRVCKPGGRIAMANFTADGLLAEFLAPFLPYLPPPRAGDLPPPLWGNEEHVRELFGGRLRELSMPRRSYVERADSPEAYCELLKRTFGPVTAIYAGLASQPDRIAELDRAFLRFAESCNSGAPGGPAEYRYDYLLVTGNKR